MTPSLRQHPALYDGGEQELCDVTEGRFPCLLLNSYTGENEEYHVPPEVRANCFS